MPPTIRLNVEQWRYRLLQFLEEQNVGNATLHLNELSSDGQSATFVASAGLERVSRSLFDAVESTFGPVVTVSQNLDANASTQRLVFYVSAPNEAQSRALYDEVQRRRKLLSRWTLPSAWPYALLLLALLALLAERVHTLLDHWQGHDDPTHTLVAALAFQAHTSWNTVSAFIK